MNVNISSNLPKREKPLKLAVAAAHDPFILGSIQKAVEDNIIEPILIGDKNKIIEIQNKYHYSFKSEIINTKNDIEASEIAIKAASSGKADVVMKGLVQTSTFLKAVLNKEWGLRKGEFLSYISMFVFGGNHYNKRPIFMTDPAINIAPTLIQKKAIIENAVEVAHKLGVETPNVAMLCAIETVSVHMQATLDAAVLSKMNDRGQISGCVVDGPLAFDNIISIDAANQKGIKSPVAGNADIVVVPYIEVGNVLYKTFNFFSVDFCAGVVAGATAPIVMTSRSDPGSIKYNSIYLSTLLAN